MATATGKAPRRSIVSMLPRDVVTTYGKKAEPVAKAPAAKKPAAKKAPAKKGRK